MNQATKKVFTAVAEGDYDRAHRIIAEYGHPMATAECGITWFRLGDDVICVRSYTQIDLTGYLSAEPYARIPRTATPAAGYEGDENELRLVCQSAG